MEIYPEYLQAKTGELMAFISKTEMYRITNQGTNSGCEGISIDHYITRKMVLKYRNYGIKLTKEEFLKKYDRLFAAYREKLGQ